MPPKKKKSKKGKKAKKAAPKDGDDKKDEDKEQATELPTFGWIKIKVSLFPLLINFA